MAIISSDWVSLDGTAEQGQQRFGQAEVLPSRDLEVVGGAVDDSARVAEGLDELGVVGDGGPEVRSVRVRLAEQVEAEGLRRLDREEPSRGTVSRTSRSEPTRFNVSETGNAGIAAPWDRAASKTASIKGVVGKGRAASWMATNSADGSTRSRQIATVSNRSAPPSTTTIR